MKFSVLLSLYNKENPLNYDACLNSIALQTLTPSEVIIVYDGYIDESLNRITERYMNNLNIKIKYLKENVGLGEALRIGVISCTHNIIARMDTDDICLNDRFEKQISYLIHNQNVDILGSSILEFDENTGEERLKILPINNSKIIDFLSYKNPINHMTVIFKKDKIISVGSYKHHHFMEDYNLWIRCASAGLIFHNLKDVLVKARIGNHMLKKRKGLKYINSEFKLFNLKNKNLNVKLYKNIFILLVRITTRTLPDRFLKYLYQKDRTHI